MGRASVSRREYTITRSAYRPSLGPKKTWLVTISPVLRISPIRREEEQDRHEPVGRPHEDETGAEASEGDDERGPPCSAGVHEALAVSDDGRDEAPVAGTPHSPARSQKLFLTVSTSTSRRRSSPAGLATGAQPYRSTIGPARRLACVESPEISVVIPCLNEEDAVGAVVDQAWEGIGRSGRTGEVIVVDNASTDRRPTVAAEHGATIVREERPGYGSAYLAGLAVARGEFIVMGDADETYPLRELAPFVERLAAGDDLVMGSRFEGTIHGEAMPWLNRHVGNPILTGLLNLLFGVKVSDAHCGMRAVRRDALESLDLHSTGMEFASEMVFKAFRRGLG